MKSQKNESVEWTNEKHSSYLKSMEASFVDQLYSYTDTFSARTQTDSSSDSMSSRKVHVTPHIPSGQFNVLQRGCWSKINFMRETPQLDKTNRTYVAPGNSRIKHFRTGSRCIAVASPSTQETPSSTGTSQGIPVSDSRLRRQESGGSNTEVTDQNFVEEEDAIEKAKRWCSRKRMRTSVVDQSSNDQVVPFVTFPVTKVAGSYVSPNK